MATFTDAFNNLEQGEATKRGSWAGYIAKEAGSVENEYKAVFVKRNGERAEYKVSSAGVVTTDSPLTLTAELMTALLSDDWVTGSAASFEEARAGTEGGEF